MMLGLKPFFEDFLPEKLKSDFGLFGQGTNTRIPCAINSISITSTNVVPQEPTDYNVYVADTVIRKPLTISLELYVYEKDADEFFRVVERANAVEGFQLVNRTGRQYRDLYLTDLSHSYTNEKLGGFDCSMELIEVIKVKAVGSTRATLATTTANTMKEQGTNTVKDPNPAVANKYPDLDKISIGKAYQKYGMEGVTQKVQQLGQGALQAIGG